MLKCEIKWALGRIMINKASGGDGIPVELFQILKDNTGKASLVAQMVKVSACNVGDLGSIPGSGRSPGE